MLLALAPIVPILAALGLAGTAVAFYLWGRGRDQQLGNGKAVKPLGPGEEPKPPGAPSELVELWSGRNVDGRFHDTQSGDSVNGVVTKVLNAISPGAGNDPQIIGAVRVLINRSEFNRTLFGEPGEGTWSVDGMHVVNAFMPKHEDTIETMSLGFWPVRNIDASGKRVGPSQKWGNPWIPNLNHEAVIAGIEDPDLLLAEDWADGSSATEPPPELRNVLEERA